MKIIYKEEYDSILDDMCFDFWKDMESKDTGQIVRIKRKQDYAALPYTFFLIPYINRKPVGYCRVLIYEEEWCYERHAEILDLYVLPEWRNSGIGTTLIDEAEKTLKYKFGIRKIRITYLTGNYRAGKLYKSLGYKENVSQLIKEI